MLVDTHCHINMMVKKEFDRPMIANEVEQAKVVVAQAAAEGVTTIINVGTSIVESYNCLAIAQSNEKVYASVGIHPNDLTDNWKDEIALLDTMIVKTKGERIVAIGETGMDKHYPDYNIQKQEDAFKMQIELALKHDLALIVHTRDAPQETLSVLERYKNQGLRGTIHCFSEDLSFAQTAISWGFVLGIGGTITYPKNTVLRDVVRTVGIEHIILETDAPFLPPQIIRGKQNHPKFIKAIAEFVGELTNNTVEHVAQITTENVDRIFKKTKHKSI